MGRLTTKQRVQTIEETAHALTDLNIFYAIIALAEGSFLRRPESQGTAEKIVRLCKVEAGKCLRDYDAGRAALKDQQHG